MTGSRPVDNAVLVICHRTTTDDDMKETPTVWTTKIAEFSGTLQRLGGGRSSGTAGIRGSATQYHRFKKSSVTDSGRSRRIGNEQM